MSIGDVQPDPTQARGRSLGAAPPRPSRTGIIGRIPPSAAAAARPMLVLLPVLTFLIPSVALAMVRQPVYTSEARLLVAGFDVQAAAIPGFVEASRSLAETYARLVETDAIVTPVVKDMGVPRGQVAGHISATSIPNSAIIKVDGKASSPEEAVKVTTAAADALVNYAKRISGGASEASLLQQYRDASVALSEAQLRQSAAEAAVTRAGTDATALAAARQALADAQADVAAARLRADRAGSQYTNGGSGGGVQLIGPALDAYSDKRSKLQLAIAAPTLLGLIVGVALATLVVNRGPTSNRIRTASEPDPRRR
jgi:capsular polysaccharide biosynthesis protein